LRDDPYFREGFRAIPDSPTGRPTIPNRLVISGIKNGNTELIPAANGSLEFFFPQVPPGKRWFIQYLAVTSNTAGILASALALISVGSPLSPLAWMQGTRTYSGPFVLEQGDVLRVFYTGGLTAAGAALYSTMWGYEYDSADAVPFAKAAGSFLLGTPKSAPAPPVNSNGLLSFPYQIGPWYQINLGTTSSTTGNTGDEILVPFWVTNTITLDRLAVEITTANAACNWVTRMGIYSNLSATSYYPGALLVDGGVDAAEVAIGISTVTISKQLTPGVYWFATKRTGTAGETAMRTLAAGSIPPEGFYPWVPLGTSAATLNGIGMNNALMRTGIAAGAFPDPYPAGVAYATTTSNIPVRAFRVASIDS